MIGRFDFSKFIYIIMHLDVHSIQVHRKTIHLEKNHNDIQFWNGGSIHEKIVLPRTKWHMVKKIKECSMVYYLSLKEQLAKNTSTSVAVVSRAGTWTVLFVGRLKHRTICGPPEARHFGTDQSTA